jgi:hypothetical protein
MKGERLLETNHEGVILHSEFFILHCISEGPLCAAECGLGLTPERVGAMPFGSLFENFLEFLFETFAGLRACFVKLLCELLHEVLLFFVQA